ncbi:hypothetical protein Tco_1246424, partial [Tanacetum coccineum]
LQVKQKEDGIFISQDKYVIEILKKFGFTDVKTASTPMETQKHFLKDKDGEEMYVHLYRSMIGSLMYLTSSRPDIMFVNLKDSPFDLVAYTDSDYAGASLDRKSTTGGCQFLGCRLILWQWKKQTVVANSTTEAEYVAASSGCGQVLWIQNQLLDYGDSNEKKLIQMIKIHTDKNVTDLLTKAFDGEGSEVPYDPHHTPIITQPSSSQPQRKQKSKRPKEKDTQVPQSSVPSNPTNVADEAVNTQEITSLKKRVKKLEKKGGSRTHKLKRLYKGRKIHDIDADEDITLENVHDAEMFNVNDLDGDEVVVESKVTDKAGEKRNIVEEAVVVTDVVTIPVSADTITNVELTLAQTLVELKSARSKTKGVVMQEPSESTLTISLQLPSQVKGQGSKDKGKAKMIEPEKPLKKKDQIKSDEEETLRLQEKFDEEDRLAREKAQQVEESNID